MNRTIRLGCSLILLAISISSCRKSATPAEYNAKAANVEYYNSALNKLTDVIIHDIFSPPVASRIYSYANLAGYEALTPFDANYESMGGKLKRFTASPRPEAGKEYCFPLASTHAFLTIGPCADLFG